MPNQFRFRGSRPPQAGGRTPLLGPAPSASEPLTGLTTTSTLTLHNQAEAPLVDDDGVATLRLYDPIDSWGGEWGVSAKEFGDALARIPDASEIRLHLNSPGGDAYEGIAILNQLRQHPANVVVVVDGLAASAASFIATGADETVMSPNSQLMIHDAWGICMGPAADMSEMAGLLDKVSNNIADIYARKSGGDAKTWRKAMKAETWYDADEAVTAGLADRVDEGPAVEAKNSFDLSVFTYAGRDAAPEPLIPDAAPVAASVDLDPRVARHRLNAKRLGLPLT
jgi:ATP-dependent Clp endopeptidase proteolytic subunit ClpP